MKNINEGNVIIVIKSMKKIIDIFLGPFLTAYFIKASIESIIDLSIYKIFSFLILGLFTFIVAGIVKNKFKIGMFRISIFINFIYIITIIILKDQIINHLGLISILYGISASAYWFTYNLFEINKIDNKIRTQYTVKSKIISSLVGILCPLILGSIITVSNYYTTAIIILVVSIIQIIASFLLKPMDDTNLPKFNLLRVWKKIKKDTQVKRMLLLEYLIGFNISDGALEVVMTILIINAFKTDINLGIISSISTCLSLLVIYFYGKKYKHKDDSKIMTISSIIPTISLILLLLIRNSITVIVYEFCYVIFVGLLSLAREVRLYNISDSRVIDKEKQAEFFSIREFALNMGRVTSFTLLLIAGFIGGNIALNILIVILTLSIPIMGYVIKKIDKFEE